MERKNEIVWVFGNSGAGKETFVVAATAGNEAAEMAGKFGWTGMDVMPCNESIDWVEQSKGDGKVGQRKKLPEIIAGLAAQESSVVLVKGQFLDLVAGRPDEVRRAMPECRHRIIFINTDSEETYERLQSRPWWNPKWTTREVLGWVKDQVKLLAKIGGGFDMITVDGGAGKGYAVSVFPPELK